MLLQNCLTLFKIAIILLLTSPNNGRKFIKYIAIRSRWMLGSKSQLSIGSKLLLYKAILKPIWTYDVQLWGTDANSNIEIIQRFQNKYLRIIVNAAWYVTNDTLHHDLNVPYVEDEIKKFSQRYADRLEEHPNTLAIDLMSEAEILRRLRRKQSQDLYI